MDPAATPPQTLLDALYKEYWHELRRHIASRFGAGPPEPDEVAQIAFTRFAALENPHSIENPWAFLVRTAQNVVIDHARRAGLEAQHWRQAAADSKNTGAALDDRSPEFVLLVQEEIRLLREKLAAMPEVRRRLLLLQRVEGLSYAELARMTGLSQTTVKYHVAMALADCADALDREITR